MGKQSRQDTGAEIAQMNRLKQTPFPTEPVDNLMILAN